MAGSGLLFFLCFDFSFSLMPLNHEKKGVVQKQKQKQFKKQFGTLFLWLRCVLLLWPIFFYPVLAIFLFHLRPKAADPDRSQRKLGPGPD
jgi:hypothetical protein